MLFCLVRATTCHVSIYCCYRVGEMTTYVLQLGKELAIHNIVYIWYFNAATNQCHLNNHACLALVPSNCGYPIKTQ